MFLDTSGLLCLHNRAEPFHDHALTLYHAARGRLTHNYVLAEFVALANARRLPRVAALTYIVDLVGTPDIEQYGLTKRSIVKLWSCCSRGKTKHTRCAMP